jgi:hypothetical protein
MRGKQMKQTLVEGKRNELLHSIDEHLSSLIEEIDHGLMTATAFESDIHGDLHQLERATFYSKQLFKIGAAITIFARDLEELTERLKKAPRLNVLNGGRQ